MNSWVQLFPNLDFSHLIFVNIYLFQLSGTSVDLLLRREWENRELAYAGLRPCSLGSRPGNASDSVTGWGVPTELPSPEHHNSRDHRGKSPVKSGTQVYLKSSSALRFPFGFGQKPRDLFSRVWRNPHSVKQANVLSSVLPWDTQIFLIFGIL